MSPIINERELIMRGDSAIDNAGKMVSPIQTGVPVNARKMWRWLNFLHQRGTLLVLPCLYNVTFPVNP